MANRRRCSTAQALPFIYPPKVSPYVRCCIPIDSALFCISMRPGMRAHIPCTLHSHVTIRARVADTPDTKLGPLHFPCLVSMFPCDTVFTVCVGAHRVVLVSRARRLCLSSAISARCTRAPPFVVVWFLIHVAHACRSFLSLCCATLNCTRART